MATTQKTVSQKTVSPRIGSRQEWLTARLALLEAEKDLTRRSDEVARQRQQLPRVRLDKEYRFDTDEGSASLPDLFQGRSQLLVYHFMYGSDFKAGCPTCSSIADGFNGFRVHLVNHDVNLWAISRAPLATLQAYQRRMGWTFPWASSADNQFNFDFNVSFTDEQLGEGITYNYEPVDMSPLAEGQAPPVVAQVAEMSGTDVMGYVAEGPGLSAFTLDEGEVFHTYSGFARGVEFLMGYYPILDRVSKGRDEEGMTDFWLRRHDEYEGAG